VLRWYAEVFGSHPLTLITDGDYALHLAIIEVLGTYFAAWCHILCVWHIAQLVAKHVKHTFGAAVAGKRGGGSDKRWNKFNRGIWRMAKCSDIQSIPNLAAEFEELREMIEELGTSDFASGPIEAVLAWLGKPGKDDDNWGTLWGRRQQFCPRFTHSRFTWGADSSGRCESINSVLKNPFNSLVHGKMRLLQLLPSVIKLEREANAKAEL